ncbi:MAG: orotidine-5'-phosphate decarboxylase [Spirochaetes bacterium]|nr:orotidine-5'-phosphate decarboxylase [Spirochaetota bacterium]
MYNIDKLFESVKERGAVCVGLDTGAHSVPPAEVRKADSAPAAVLAFNKALIEATCDIAACYKVQIAFYEEMGLEGFKVYAETLQYIRKKGLLAIADIKRGDIADTAARYAKAHFDGELEADFVTLSPYMGMDTLDPWLAWAKSKGKGAFILMRTSNAGMRDFQYLEVAGGGGRLYNAVGDKLSLLAKDVPGKYGYGAFGAVIGCTEKDEVAEIRKNYANLFFLVPGYGAQGGGAQDAALFLHNGNGAVVNASRSIIEAWRGELKAAGTLDETSIGNDFAAGAARKAAAAMQAALQDAARVAARVAAKN